MDTKTERKRSRQEKEIRSALLDETRGMGLSVWSYEPIDGDAYCPVSAHGREDVRLRMRCRAAGVGWGGPLDSQEPDKESIRRLVALERGMNEKTIMAVFPHGVFFAVGTYMPSAAVLLCAKVYCHTETVEELIALGRAQEDRELERMVILPYAVNGVQKNGSFRSPTEKDVTRNGAAIYMIRDPEAVGRRLQTAWRRISQWIKGYLHPRGDDVVSAEDVSRMIEEGADMMGCCLETVEFCRPWIICRHARLAELMTLVCMGLATRWSLERKVRCYIGDREGSGETDYGPVIFSMQFSCPVPVDRPNHLPKELSETLDFWRARVIDCGGLLEVYAGNPYDPETGTPFRMTDDRVTRRKSEKQVRADANAWAVFDFAGRPFLCRDLTLTLRIAYGAARERWGDFKHPDPWSADAETYDFP